MKYISIKSLIAGSSLLLLAMSCSRQETSSSTKEAPDGNSSFTRLGDIGSLKYEDIAKINSVATARVPWADTYWPNTQKGLSRRWKSTEKTVGMAEYFTSQAAQSKAIKVDPYLSPADKYDILYRWRHNVEIDEAQMATLVSSWDALERGLDMNAELTVSRASVLAASQKFRSGENAAFRDQFPMSSDGWSNWLYYTSNDKYKFLDKENSGEDWSWMGSCHGWAPAALMAETPKHAVLAKFDKKEVLITEGDIRGLLTKSWADHAPDEAQYFIGRRCEKNAGEPFGAIPAGAKGRGLYGEITRGEAKTGFYVKAEMYTGFTRPADRIYPLSYDDSDGVQGFLLETYLGRSKKYAYVLAANLDSIRNYIVDGNQADIETLSSVEMFGCWDVNPATFHMALLQKIGKESLGLVMDRTRTGQVWNQPVYGAKFNIGPALGIANVPASKTRAPGTEYVAAVDASVDWISEPARPRFVYSKEFNLSLSKTSHFKYVLEFDADMNLIGGEWDTLEANDPEAVTPDFLFGFDKGSKPVDDLAGGFDFTGIIEQIHSCSLTEATDGSVNLDHQNIPYSTCILTKAP